MAEVESKLRVSTCACLFFSKMSSIERSYCFHILKHLNISGRNAKKISLIKFVSVHCLEAEHSDNLLGISHLYFRNHSTSCVCCLTGFATVCKQF